MGFPQSAVETRARAETRAEGSSASEAASRAVPLILLTLGLCFALTGHPVPASVRMAFATVRPLQGGIAVAETIRPAAHPVVASRSSRSLPALPKLEAKAAFSAATSLRLAGNLSFSPRLDPDFISQDGWSGPTARAPPINGIL